MPKRRKSPTGGAAVEKLRTVYLRPKPSRSRRPPGPLDKPEAHERHFETWLDSVDPAPGSDR